MLDGLLGLMERLPISSVRLIIFNLEQQEELLRRKAFTVSELDGVARALKELELGSVQLGVLEKPKGHIDLITSLLNTEIRSSSPSDAIVFLGPQERYFDKAPDGALDTPRGYKPRFYSVQLRLGIRRARNQLWLRGRRLGCRAYSFAVQLHRTHRTIFRTLHHHAHGLRFGRDAESDGHLVSVAARRAASCVAADTATVSTSRQEYPCARSCWRRPATD